MERAQVVSLVEQWLVKSADQLLVLFCIFVLIYRFLPALVVLVYIVCIIW